MMNSTKRTKKNIKNLEKSFWMKLVMMTMNHQQVHQQGSSPSDNTESEWFFIK